MFKLLILAVAIAVSAASLDADWAVYKAEHEKSYSGKEERYRRAVWEMNLQKIRTHNELYANGQSTYYLGQNEYADMTHPEFVKTMNGYNSWRGWNKVGQEVQTPDVDTESLPTTVDWVKKGYVTGVKNQGQCGSCWAFSTTGSLEGAHFKKSKKLVSLSEKNLMDCSKSYGNQGCNGGLMDQAFQYVIANKGIDTEKSYPYHPKDGPCRFKRADVGATEISYVDVVHGSEAALQKAVAEVGPISVAIDASHNSFQLYKGGVYNEPQCSSSALDHGVLAVGYGVDGGKDYWLVKNSWGTSWGIKGYIMMSRNKNNQCGIATEASYPKV